MHLHLMRLKYEKTEMLVNTEIYSQNCFHKQLFQKLQQLTFIFSQSGIETLEKGVKYVQVNNEKYQSVIDIVLVFFLLTLNIFHTFF